MILLATLPARGGDFFWEPQGWDGAGDVPSGTWSTFAPNWYKSNAPTVHYRGWDNTPASAHFCYGGTATNTYTISVSDEELVMVQEMYCEAGSPIITGPGVLKLYADTRWISVNSNLTFTINTTLTNNMSANFTEALHKYGMGTLVLGATNYLQNVNGVPGSLVIEGGTVKLSVPHAFAYTNSLILTNGGRGGLIDTPATFNTGGFDHILGTLGLTGGNPAIARTIDFNSDTGALSFTDSSAENWTTPSGSSTFTAVSVTGQTVSLSWSSTAGATYRLYSRETISSPDVPLGGDRIATGDTVTATDTLSPNSRFYRVEAAAIVLPLTVTNYTKGASTLRFGTSNTGLTPAQLGAIRFADYGNVSGVIDSDGYVTPATLP